eukprot:scaffold75698_cov62-Phaeocystis_antarctica.AAC.1
MGMATVRVVRARAVQRVPGGLPSQVVQRGRRRGRNGQCQLVRQRQPRQATHLLREDPHRHTGGLSRRGLGLGFATHRPSYQLSSLVHRSVRA